jgi:hypothetical protein
MHCTNNNMCANSYEPFTHPDNNLALADKDTRTTKLQNEQGKILMNNDMCTRLTFTIRSPCTSHVGYIYA